MNCLSGGTVSIAEHFIGGFNFSGLMPCFSRGFCEKWMFERGFLMVNLW
jgi:hypothetical protein